MNARLPDRPAPALGVTALHIPTHAPASEVSKAKQNWLLYAFLFLLPLQNLQTGYMPNFGGGLNFLNIGFIFALCGAIACRGTVTRWSSVQSWVLAYVAYSCFSLLIGYTNVHSDTEEHFNVLKDAMLAVMLVFVAQMSVNDWSTIKRVILVTILPMPYMLRVVWSQHNSVSSWHYSDNLRISGTFSQLGANEFSAFCVTMAVILLALLIAAKWSRWWKILLVGGIACMSLGVIWTYSRTAYITIILGSLAVMLLWRGRWKMIVPLFFVALLLPAVLPTAVTERFDSTTIEEGKRDESTQARFEFWAIAWQNFTEHPLFGSGYHTFHHHEINPYNKDTHNFFMRELTEKGLVGFIVIFGLLLSIVKASWRIVRESPHNKLSYALGLGMVAAWIALVVGNCFGDRFTYYPVIGYFWVYVGLTLKAYDLMRLEKAAPAATPTAQVSKPRFAQPRRSQA